MYWKVLNVESLRFRRSQNNAEQSRLALCWSQQCFPAPHAGDPNFWDRLAWTTGQFGSLRTATNGELALDTFHKLYRLFENTGVNLFPETT